MAQTLSCWLHVTLAAVFRRLLDSLQGHIQTPSDPRRRLPLSEDAGRVISSVVGNRRSGPDAVLGPKGRLLVLSLQPQVWQEVLFLRTNLSHNQTEQNTFKAAMMFSILLMGSDQNDNELLHAWTKRSNFLKIAQESVKSKKFH